MRFAPTEVLFSPTSSCNLSCPHCDGADPGRILSRIAAKRFLNECAKTGVRKVGFTGGEPFLTPDFLCEVVKDAVKHDMRFDRIMTNGVWYKDEDVLRQVLGRLYSCGYDGSICVSVDAFHDQNLKKVSNFIKTASAIWGRPDLISIAYASGIRDRTTKNKITRLARRLKARLTGFGTQRATIVRDEPLFIRIFKIELSPVGKASKLKDAWGDKNWFKEDYCKGPGNVFFVTAGGDVKPCCGYATGNAALTIGNIRRDSARRVAQNAARNTFVQTVFGSGLTAVRKNLERLGVKFPGRTANHCYFCDYVLNVVDAKVLKKCLSCF